MRWLAPVLLAAAALLWGGCLGTLRHDPAAEAITLAPHEVLDLPLHERRTYWLLRSQPGWVSAHEVKFGGEEGDPGVATIRAAIFRDADAAGRAFARLTPEYLYLLLRDRMSWAPRPFAYPVPLPGDEVAVTEYGVRLPPELTPHVTLVGQMTAVRAGRVVILVESIGVPPEQLVPAIEALTEAAYRLTAAGSPQSG